MAVAYEGSDATPGKTAIDFAGPDVPQLQGKAAARQRYLAWADLMRRAFEFDVLVCPRCGERMRLIATIEDPRVIRQILAHLGLPTEVPPAPAPAGSRR